MFTVTFVVETVGSSCVGFGRHISDYYNTGVTGDIL